ncbi:MAG: isoprenylcysteine carboxylmethyltransferase family protein [Alphaproteobacteria bacterium]|nr:isoprenylcysteine carboxylmethyltransferase family protein [Alphaproteobacteria bacterium]
MRLAASNVVSTSLFAALIIGSSYLFTGIFNWPRGWLVVALFFFVSFFGGLYFLARDPGLVEERAKMPRPKTLRDTAASLVILASVIGFCLAAVWDARTRALLPMQSGVSLAAGLIVFGLAIAIMVWTFRVNSFGTTVVEVQEARNQRVIDSGPYRFVRHPMYHGAVWFFVGMALMLGSLALALAAIVVFPLAFAPRILVEESVLRRDLTGYADYQRRVRIRIFPGVF